MRNKSWDGWGAFGKRGGEGEGRRRGRGSEINEGGGGGIFNAG